MKFITTDSLFFAGLSPISKNQSLHILGGSGQVDRDKEEKEDIPVVSNDIPTDYPKKSALNRFS